ncbi:MAG: hypothetical protein Q8876_00275 [Bacillota bacterium]|nr:hypothetical protein [Bacillota bacterium]
MGDNKRETEIDAILKESRELHYKDLKEKERLEQERLEKEKFEQECLEKERLEQEQKAKQEEELQVKERIEQALREQQRVEEERLEKERQEIALKEKALREKARREKEQDEKEFKEYFGVSKERHKKAKEKPMEEIFSNKSKEPRLINQAPLDLDKPKTEPKPNVINEDKPQLEPTFDFAGQLGQDDVLSSYEKRFGKPEPVISDVSADSKVPIYVHDSDVNILNVKAGKFSQVVREEYKTYKKIKHVYITTDSKRNIPQEKEEIVTVDSEEKQPLAKSVLNGIFRMFANNGEEEEHVAKQNNYEKTVTLEDYEKPEDSRSVMNEIGSNIKKIFFRNTVLTILLLGSLIVNISHRSNLNADNMNSSSDAIIFCFINFALILVAMAICSMTVINGLSKLRKFKGNSDTSVAVLGVLAFFQSIISLFSPLPFYQTQLHLFGLLAIFAFFLNSLGKMFLVNRVRDNFKFLSSKGEKSAAKIYEKDDIARKMISGTTVENPIIVYQQRSGFFKNFLKISYAPDPSEELAAKIAPITATLSLVVGIVYGVINKDVFGAVSIAAVVAAVSVPAGSLLSVNASMRRLCKKTLTSGAMLTGFPSVKQFGAATAVMMDSRELYPKGSIILNNVKTFNSVRIEESMLAAAAIMKEAGNPMVMVFDDIIEKNKSLLPKVESVMYEDTLGLVGWIAGERVLIGTRNLLDSYGVEVPDSNLEKLNKKEGKQTVFLAHSGQLIAVFSVTYRANLYVVRECQRAEYNGLSLLVRTTDCNITGEQIAKDFGIFFRSVKVLPTGLGNACEEVMTQRTEEDKAYIVTKGKITSLLRVISGCVKMRSNTSIVIIIQLIAVIIGLLFVILIAFNSNISHLGDIELFGYMALWAFASLVAPMIQLP